MPSKCAVLQATAARGPSSEDLVSLVVDGAGEAALTWTPASVPSSLQGAEGALALLLRTRRPLELTANGAVVAV